LFGGGSFEVEFKEELSNICRGESEVERVEREVVEKPAGDDGDDGSTSFIGDELEFEDESGGGGEDGEADGDMSVGLYGGAGEPEDFVGVVKGDDHKLNIALEDGVFGGGRELNRDLAGALVQERSGQSGWAKLGAWRLVHFAEQRPGGEI
jgi:hypothetical protein